MTNTKDESVVVTTEKAKSEVKKPRKPSTKKVASEKKSLDANSSKDFQAVNKNIEAKIDAFFEANKDSGIKKLVSASKLMESGCHIGMSAKWWNPKMRPFIYPGKGGKNQIIDILKTIIFLDRAYNFLRDITKEGGRILFVGTRGDYVKNLIKNECTRSKSFYINQRWLGGTLTNFKTISKSIDKLNNLISLQMSDEIKRYSKKEQLDMSKEVEKMSKFLNGIRTMRGLPQAIVVTDPIAEHNAVSEAKKLGIPVVAIANTNTNPDVIDFLIPANTTSIRTIFLIVTILNDAICEALGEPLSIVGKKDEEIILPEVAKKKFDQGFIAHKKFGRSFQKSNEEKPVEKK